MLTKLKQYARLHIKVELDFASLARLSRITKKDIQVVPYPADGKPCYALLDKNGEITDYLLDEDVVVTDGDTWVVLTPQLFNFFFK